MQRCLEAGINCWPWLKSFGREGWWDRRLREHRICLAGHPPLPRAVARAERFAAAFSSLSSRSGSQVVELRGELRLSGIIGQYTW